MYSPKYKKKLLIKISHSFKMLLISDHTPNTVIRVGLLSMFPGGVSDVTNPTYKDKEKCTALWSVLLPGCSVYSDSHMATIIRKFTSRNQKACFQQGHFSGFSHIANKA